MDMIDVPKRPHNMILEIDTESLLVTVYQGVGFSICAPLEYNYVDTMEHSRVFQHLSQDCKESPVSI